MDGLRRRLAVARGDEPADLVVRGGRVLSVFTKEWLETDVAVVDGVVAGLGAYEGREVLDVSGSWVAPGFVDAHMHLESTKLLPDEFARLVLPLGTTAVVADPHELANVLGTDGVHWLLDACEDLPLDFYFMASSCVPASPFESPRRPLSPGDLESLLRRRRVLGVAEMMNFPGVIAGDESELAKLFLEEREHVDGHAPGVAGKQLNAYASAGIRSDHEALTLEEGRERLRAGMWLLVREASMARNLLALLPLVHEFGTNRIAFCTDDRDPEDIAENGHINGMVREAVAFGIAPEDALVLGSHNAALWHGLDQLGAIAPGYQADLLVLPDLERFEPSLVLKRGKQVDEVPHPEVPEWVQALGADRAGHRRGLPGALGGRRRARDRARSGSGRHGGARGAADRGRRRCRRGSLARPRRDRRGRAPPRHGPDRARLRARVGPRSRRARLDRRPRCAQHRRRRREPRGHGYRGHAARRDRRRHRRCRGRRRARGAAARRRRACSRTPRSPR